MREADAHFHKQLELAQGLVTGDPLRIEYLRALAGAYENLGSVFAHDKKCQAAHADYEKALTIFEGLRARNALSAEYVETPARLTKLIEGCR